MAADPGRAVAGIRMGGEAVPDNTIKRVLIYRIGSLGDTVITLPCLHLVARAFPRAKRVMVTNRPRVSRSAASVAVLEGSGLIDKFWLIQIGVKTWMDKLTLLLKIRLYRPQVLVYLSEAGRVKYLHRDRTFFRLAGIKRIYGMGDGGSLEHHVDARSYEWEPEASRLARSLRNLGDAAIERPENWDLHLTPAERRVASEKLAPLHGMRFFACAPGSNRQTTDWGREQWRALSEELSQAYPEMGMVLLGSAADNAMADQIGAGWKGPKLNLCGQLAPRETAAVLERAALYMGPDSGPMHLAAAVGTKCVAPFSARVMPKVWFPFGTGHKVILHKTDCAGCWLDTCVAEKHRCMTSITVDEMAQAVAASVNDSVVARP
ncbi:glycosyltransferase family 9 protein [Paraburkholderia caffeinitolerans]|nr:glycosyltransferase family 9 protein [Paraburkholderia caffeinitolerans]